MLVTSYTWSHAIDNISPLSLKPADGGDPYGDQGITSTMETSTLMFSTRSIRIWIAATPRGSSIRHRVVVSGQLEIPVWNQCQCGRNGCPEGWTIDPFLT